MCSKVQLLILLDILIMYFSLKDSSAYAFFYHIFRIYSKCPGLLKFYFNGYFCQSLLTSLWGPQELRNSTKKLFVWNTFDILGKFLWIYCIWRSLLYFFIYFHVYHLCAVTFVFFHFLQWQDYILQILLYLTNSIPLNLIWCQRWHNSLA